MIFGVIESMVTWLHREFVDSDKVAMGHERECVHTRAEATVKVTMSIVADNPPSQELEPEPAK
jgi:hypothetical protein